MPLVTVIYAPRVQEQDLHLMFRVARQVVPAGLDCAEGKLKPGDIEYHTVASTNADYTSVDVIIKVDATDYVERRATIEQRTREMVQAFESIFPLYTFAIAVNLGLASWESTALNDSAVPWHGDMSMGMATFRARQDIDAYWENFPSELMGD